MHSFTPYYRYAHSDQQLLRSPRLLEAGTQPCRRPGIAIGLGLLQRLMEATIGNTVCQKPRRKVLRHLKEKGERRRGARPPSRTSSLRRQPGPGPLSPSPRSYPAGAAAPLRPPLSPPPARPSFLCRLFFPIAGLEGRAQPPALTSLVK